MASKMQEPYVNTTCMKCGFGQFKEGHDTGDWWLACNDCGSLLFCYNPMPHQYDFHADYHKYKAFFGGYG